MNAVCCGSRAVPQNDGQIRPAPPNRADRKPPSGGAASPSSGLTKRAISAISSEYSSYASASRFDQRLISRTVTP